MGMDIGSGPKKKGRAAPVMNVTPLVDVVLVLLIIFMVVTPLLAKQFWINLPDEPDEEQEPPPPSEDDGPIVVTVTQEGDIRINREVIPDSDLERKLRRVLAAKRERTIFFDAADDAEVGRAVEVMDKARGGGAAKIAVMTEALPELK
ncbi:MAG: ExbD/TolR family protein [Myxococcota bacterium]